MIWREKRLVLIVLAILLVVNTVFFFTYRVQYEDRLQELDQRKSDAESALAQARATRLNAERQYAAYMKIQRDLQLVYDERWSTVRDRLTALINEVKRLAVVSQLIPKTYSFTKAEIKGETTANTASAVGISFNVQGTYIQARRLINLLELSPQFVIIDQISLSSSGGNDPQLNLDLHLKTLFREPQALASLPVNKEM